MDWNHLDDGPAEARPAYRVIGDFDEMLDIDDDIPEAPIEDDDCGDAGELAQAPFRRPGA